MLFTNVTQLAVLGLVLILGLVLGLLIAPKGTKWRRQYEQERDAHATYRTEADTRLRERDTLTTNRDAYVRDLEAEKASLIAENEALKTKNVDTRPGFGTFADDSEQVRRDRDPADPNLRPRSI